MARMMDQLIMDFKNQFAFGSTDEAGTAVLQSTTPSERAKLERMEVSEDPNLYNIIKSKATRNYGFRVE